VERTRPVEVRAMVTMKRLLSASRDALVLVGVLAGVLVEHGMQVSSLLTPRSAELREQRRIADRNPPAKMAAASIMIWELRAAYTLPSRRHALWKAIDGPDDPGPLHVKLRSVMRIQSEGETDAFLDRARCATTLDKDELRREIAILRAIAQAAPEGIKFVRHDFFPDGGIIPEWFVREGSRRPVEDFHPRRVPLIEEVLETRLEQFDPAPERYLTVMAAVNILFGFDSIAGFRSAGHRPISGLMDLEVGGTGERLPSISRPYVFLDPSGEYMVFSTYAARHYSEDRTPSGLNLEIARDRAGKLFVFSWVYHGREFLRYRRESSRAFRGNCGKR